VDPKKSTIAALLEEKPKRGRPPRKVGRQNVYVALTAEQKAEMQTLARMMPGGVKRADVPDLAIALLGVRLEGIRRMVADRNREMPEGITDLDSLYLLWDLPLPLEGPRPKWTSLRVSPQQAIELGRVQGVLHALFGVNRSDVFSLSLSLLRQFLDANAPDLAGHSMAEIQEHFRGIYL
jgi:hypothetical protein